jgi:hypothetical protein
VPGAGGGFDYKLIHHTLGELGFKEAHLNIQVKDEAKGGVTLTVKDKDKLKTLLKKWTDGRDEIVREGRRFAEGQKGIGTILDFLASLTIKGTADAIVIEGKATAAFFQGFLDLMSFRPGGP